MPLHEKFLQMLALDNGFHKQHTFLVAVSGGVDSVVLCDLFHQCGLSFVMAHCNFQLRGDESVRDETFVKELANVYNKKLFIEKFDTAAYADAHKVSTQVAARELRYDWFRKIAYEEQQATYIATAHHADDNVETVVMNFFRGTGLKGLAGMDTHFQKIWRPLLPFRKEEIMMYARQHDLKFVEDSSNATTHYTRNYFRNELLPAVARVFPAVEENILKNIHRLAEVATVYDQAIVAYKQKLLEVKGTETHIPILKLKKLTPLRTLVWEIIKPFDYTAAQVDEVLKLMEAENGAFIQSASHRIIRNRKWLIVAPKESKADDRFYVIEEKDKKITFPLGQLVIENNIATENLSITADKNVALLHAAEMQYPLLLRRWKPGDYFYPLGMQKKKKLNRFFIDQKLSPLDKENVWVLESNKRVAWVIGLRMDDRFKILPSTKQVVRIHYHPSM